MPNAKIKNKEFWKRKRKQTRESIQYYDRLTELAISMFEWSNLPETVDARFLELALFGEGMAVFFKDEEMGDYLALRCMIGPGLNVYQIPIMRRAFATNGYQKELNEENSVIIFNNMIHTNSVNDVEIFAERLADLDRTIEVNARAQKTPVLIRCGQNQRLTLLNLYEQYDGNAPFIAADDNMSSEPLAAISTGAPFVSLDLYQLKTQYWNEALTYLGISNMNIQKKERMIKDEVMRQTGGVIASRYSRLESRRQACEQINKMFGLNISCDYRPDFREADDEVMFDSATGTENMQDMVIDLRTQ